MKPAFRLLALVFVIYAAVMAMRFLQAAFDQGDLRRAREAFNRFQIGQKTLWQIMAEDLAVTQQDVQCDEWLVSRYNGPVRFECFVKDRKDKLFVWDVDVAGFRVTPANPQATDLTSAGSR